MVSGGKRFCFQCVTWHEVEPTLACIVAFPSLESGKMIWLPGGMWAKNTNII